MTERRGQRGIITVAAAALALGGCGIVNGLGGPWPIGGGSSDGGVVTADGGACPEGTHNGGDGACVPEGECSAGFEAHDDGGCLGWVQEVALSPARSRHTLTALNNGTALTLGGLAGDSPLAVSEIFDPETGTWSLATGEVRARYGHRATFIGGNRVLVSGGIGPDGFETVTELFRGDQSSWVALGELSRGRVWHGAADLGGGVVAVFGGESDSGSVLASIEVLDGGDWVSSSAALDDARAEFSTTTLASGDVLVAGGRSGADAPLDTAELLSWDGDEVTSAGAAAMATARSAHTATLLDDGRVLVVGGRAEASGAPTVTATAEIYDPDGDDWQDSDSLALPRYDHAAVLLDDGRVMIIGGFGAGHQPLDTVEIFDPDNGTFSELAASLGQGHGRVPAVKMRDGSVFVVQGSLSLDDAAATETVRYRVAP